MSSAIYSIYYNRYSTPYLSGEGEREDLVVVVVVVREQETLVIRRYRTTGIYTFG